MFRKILSTVAMAVICAGCVTYGTIEPVLSSGQQLIYTSGQATIVSEKHNTVTMAPSSPTIMSGIIADFIMTVSNNSTYSWVFGPKNVNARLEGNEELSSNLHVYSYGEVMAAKVRRQRMQSAGLTVNGIFISHGEQQALYYWGFGSKQKPLQTNTLDADLTADGVVKIEMPRLSNDPQTISVDVTAGDEVHNFLFRLTKR